MQHLKIHYQVYECGTPEALEQWSIEKLTPNKAKFCDGLMLSKDRFMDFTKDTESVDCQKCLKKLESWWHNGFDLPY